VSQENVELARQVVDAFNQRDVNAMSRRFDPEIEWQPVGPAAVERAVYRGSDEVAAGFAATWEAWELFELTESEVRDLGDTVVWLGRARLRGGASRVELDQEFAVHFVVRDARVARLRGFSTWREALEAAGTSG
jgi:ketosteroid isomerase-like protein